MTFVILCQIWIRLSQPTSQSSPGRCPRFFTRARHDFFFVFRFPQRSLLLLECFVFAGRLRLIFSVSFPPGVRRSLLLSFFLRSDPSFILGPGVLGLADANFCGYSVLIRLSANRFGRVRTGVNLSSVRFISSSKTSSFVLDLICAEFLSLLTRLATVFLFASLSSASLNSSRSQITVPDRTGEKEISFSALPRDSFLAFSAKEFLCAFSSA
jgi:hypothetical protein